MENNMGIFNRLKKDKQSDVPESKAQVDNVEKVVGKKPQEKKTKEQKSQNVKSVEKAVGSVKRPGKIILKPIITEKSSMSGTYQFEIAADANRIEVAKAFTAIYEKVPRKVNIMNIRGKQVRFGRQIGKRAAWKKAIVYLNKGESIDLYSE